MRFKKPKRLMVTEEERVKLPPPKSVSRSYKAGWTARLAGKTNEACETRIPDLFRYVAGKGWQVRDDTSDHWAGVYRKQAWHTGYLHCSRALGRLRKAKRIAAKTAAETIRLNAEHDWLAELSEEFAA